MNGSWEEWMVQNYELGKTAEFRIDEEFSRKQSAVDLNEKCLI